MTELLKAPVSEKLFVFTDQPYFFFYKTKLNEKEKGDGHNHMKNNDDAFLKSLNMSHNRIQVLHTLQPALVLPIRLNVQCSLYHTVHGHGALEDSF